jgi:hypothetical protein
MGEQTSPKALPAPLCHLLCGDDFVSLLVAFEAFFCVLRFGDMKGYEKRRAGVENTFVNSPRSPLFSE